MKKSLSLLFLFLLVSVSVSAQRRGAWNRIESAEELIGLWEGSETLAIPRNKNTGIPKSSLTVTISLDYRSGGGMALVVAMDFNRFLDDWISEPQFRDAGISKDSIWEALRTLFRDALEGAEFENYTMMYRIVTETELSNDDTLRLNRDRTKLKVIFPNRLSLGMGDAGIKEMILDKKE
ncbi:MAG: hypothetical protein LBD09_05475 [Treponema sp.]|nr:hypothetical protein [Treponema sp.]